MFLKIIINYLYISFHLYVHVNRFDLLGYGLQEDPFEDAVESFTAYELEVDSDVSLGDLDATEAIPDFNDWGRDPQGLAKAAALRWSLSCQSPGMKRAALRLRGCGAGVSKRFGPFHVAFRLAVHAFSSSKSMDFHGHSMCFRCPLAFRSVFGALRKVWELPKLPLGAQELWHFGPNGPPMNVMDVCPVSKMLWVGNQPLGDG